MNIRENIINQKYFSYLDNNTLALIPAYNEAETIEKVIKGTEKHHIFPLVIDDGSIDETSKLLEDLGVQVLINRKNMGKGKSIEKGIRFIQGNPILSKKVKAIIILDGDLQYDYLKYNKIEAKKLVEPILNSEADVVLSVRRNIPYFRHWIANKLWMWLFNSLYGLKDVDGNPIKDICALRVYSKEMAFKLLNSCGFGSGYVTEAHALIELSKLKARVKQVKINANYYEKSGVKRGVRMFFGIFIFMLKKKYNLLNKLIPF